MNNRIIDHDILQNVETYLLIKELKYRGYNVSRPDDTPNEKYNINLLKTNYIWNKSVQYSIDVEGMIINMLKKEMLKEAERYIKINTDFAEETNEHVTTLELLVANEKEIR